MLEFGRSTLSWLILCVKLLTFKGAILKPGRPLSSVRGSGLLGGALLIWCLSHPYGGGGGGGEDWGGAGGGRGGQRKGGWWNFGFGWVGKNQDGNRILHADL